MGFKRTSEGRIFFQGPEDETPARPQQDNQSPKTAKPLTQAPQDFETPFNLQRQSASRPTPKTGQPKPGQASAPTQMQIITLLKTLNERLKITQGEREKMARELEDYRHIIEELQVKADRSDKAYQDLAKQLTTGGGANHAETLARDALQELEETRRMLSDLETKASRADRGVSALKKLQVDQAEKMAVSINHAAALTKRVKDTEERQELVGARVDDALSQQARLSRKIDKAVEERTRFLRKLERIEETVLQTRDSLNAKAMVLLTDQGVAAQSEMDGLAATDFTPGEYAAQAHPAQQKAPAQGQSAAWLGVVFLIIAALLGGWLINEWQNSEDISAFQEQLATTSPQDLAPTTTQETAPTDMATMDWRIEDDASAFNAQADAVQTVPEADPANDDLGTLNLNDQAQVEALLDGRPDAVAAALNETEPGNATPENIVPPEIVAEAAPVEAAPEPAPEPTPAPIVPNPAPALDAPNPLTPQDPNGLIKSDASLPDVVKNIESQAFDGVPEAQHDLAAIYTAGHGGVKQDYERAAFWFEQAASRGVANAAYNLGVLNHQGLGGSQDLKQAIEWYNRAAGLGHPEAQYNLGIAYIEGIGVPYDAEKAAGYFQNAAENNIMEAAYNLGLIYENGLLGEAEPDHALVWYKTAADQGSPEAKQALEQLAKTLNVTLDDVNELADRMKVMEKSDSAPAAAITAATTAAQSVASISPAAGTQAITAQVQEYLMRMGLYPGPADGITGPLTQDAIRSYQRMHNLNADGAASETLLSHMLANTIGEDVLVEQGSRAQ